MTNKTKTEIKAFFETGDKPNQSQFIDLIDSYVDKSGPIGILETACSGGGEGVVITNSGGTPSIAAYGTVRNSMGITVYTTALAQTALSGIFTTTADAVNAALSVASTTAQASAAVSADSFMTPILSKKLIVDTAFTTANFSTTAQANTGTDNSSIMTPVLVKNAISALGGTSAGLTVIATSTPGAVTLIDFTAIPATYRGLVLYFTGLSNTVATRGVTITIDTGLGLGNANNNHDWTQIAGTTVTGTQQNSGNCFTTVTQTAAQTTTGYINIPAYQSGPLKHYFGRITAADTTTDIGSGTLTTVWGVLTGASGVARTGAVVGIRITWDNVATGVFDAGTITLYGVN